MGTKTSFAPPHPRPNRTLSGIVRRVHPCKMHECPQGLTQLEDFPAHAFGLRHPTRAPGFQQPLDLPSHRAHVAPEARPAEGAIADAMPPVKHLPRLALQRLADLLGASPALNHRFDVPQQMRPTQLTPPYRIPIVG